MMKWFIVREEGGNIEYVTLRALKKLAEQVPIFGAERGKVRVFYDRILRHRGLGPFQKVDRENFTMELFSA